VVSDDGAEDGEALLNVERREGSDDSKGIENADDGVDPEMLDHADGADVDGGVDAELGAGIDGGQGRGIDEEEPRVVRDDLVEDELALGGEIRCGRGEGRGMRERERRGRREGWARLTSAEPPEPDGVGVDEGSAVGFEAARPLVFAKHEEKEEGAVVALERLVAPVIMHH
jgi:hypothetical protein